MICCKGRTCCHSDSPRYHLCSVHWNRSARRALRFSISGSHSVLNSDATFPLCDSEEAFQPTSLSLLRCSPGTAHLHRSYAVLRTGLFYRNRCKSQGKQGFLRPPGLTFLPHKESRRLFSPAFLSYGGCLLERSCCSLWSYRTVPFLKQTETFLIIFVLSELPRLLDSDVAGCRAVEGAAVGQLHQHGADAVRRDLAIHRLAIDRQSQAAAVAAVTAPSAGGRADKLRARILKGASSWNSVQGS